MRKVLLSTVLVILSTSAARAERGADLGYDMAGHNAQVAVWGAAGSGSVVGGLSVPTEETSSGTGMWVRGRYSLLHTARVQLGLGIGAGAGSFGLGDGRTVEDAMSVTGEAYLQVRPLLEQRLYLSLTYNASAYYTGSVCEQGDCSMSSSVNGTGLVVGAGLFF